MIRTFIYIISYNGSLSLITDMIYLIYDFH